MEIKDKYRSLVVLRIEKSDKKSKKIISSLGYEIPSEDGVNTQYFDFLSKSVMAIAPRSNVQRVGYNKPGLKLITVSQYNGVYPCGIDKIKWKLHREIYISCLLAGIVDKETEERSIPRSEIPKVNRIGKK